MNGKEIIATITIIGIFCLLPISWYMHQDGPITTALFGLLGMTAGTMLGFHFGQQQIKV